MAVEAETQGMPAEDPLRTWRGVPRWKQAGRDGPARRSSRGRCAQQPGELHQAGCRYRTEGSLAIRTGRPCHGNGTPTRHRIPPSRNRVNSRYLTSRHEVPDPVRSTANSLDFANREADESPFGPSSAGPYPEDTGLNCQREKVLLPQTTRLRLDRIRCRIPFDRGSP